MRAKFYNSFQYAKFILRREVLTSGVWLLILLALTVFVALAFGTMFESPEELLGMAITMTNPAMVAMVGPVFGLDVYNESIMYVQMMLLLVAISVGIMNIFMVVKHTRKDEEDGRLEVIRSLPVGSLSNLAATLAIVLKVNFGLSLVIGMGLFVTNMAGMTLAGALLYGFSLGAIGLLFSAIAALFAQVASTSRGALSYSFIALGIMYLVRAIGDVSVEALSLISPLGLVLRTKVFYENNLWPILIILLLSTIIYLLAFHINKARDLGAGLVAAKPGKREASSFLKTPFGFSFKLVRMMIIGWAITIFIAGASYGSVFADIETFIGDNEMLQQIFLSDPTLDMSEQFASTLMIMAAIIASVPSVAIILKLRTEEKKNRLEAVFSKSVSRSSFLINHLILALVGSVVFVVLFALGLWGASAAVMDQPMSFVNTISNALVYLPAIWTMIALATALLAFLPRLSSLAWVFLGFSFFAVYLGLLLNLPDWLISIAPYSHIPQIPIEEMSWPPLIILSLLASIMIGLGVVKYNKRDLLTS